MLGTGVILHDALPAVLCRRAIEVIIIVASAFKNLSSHEYFMNVWLVCWNTRNKLSIITGVELARNFPAELVFVNNYSVNSTFSWGVFIFVEIVNERFF